MIEEKLGVIIITYNRVKDLENTFKQLIDSPVSRCKITVLDNCSTDKTPELCAKYQKVFANMKIIRHTINIGGNSNILRAVETSKSMYTWIICDDDFYDFDDFDDVIGAITSEKYDLISPGSPGEYEWERGLSTSVKELINKKSRYFTARNFVPGTIFKTELFDSFCVLEGYVNVHNFFPIFPFMYKSLKNNFTIYISKKRAVTPGKHNYASFSPLKFSLGWMKSCLIIKEKNMRIKTIFEDTNDSSFVLKICTNILFEKISNEEDAIKNYLSLVSTIILAFGFNRNISILVLIIPLILIPKLIFVLFFKIFIYLKFDINGRKVPDYLNYLLSDKNYVDPLRKF